MIYKKLFFITILILIFCGLSWFLVQKADIKAVIVHGKTFFVEVARTKAELERGLSLHTPLQSNQGMLFVFPKDDFYGFWMKDMTFPIDIVWIDSNLRVVHVEKNVSPDTYPKIFYPETKSLYVLEILAGQTDLLKTKIGDELKFIKK